MTIATIAGEAQLIIAQAPQAAPMGIDLSGPNALVAQVFALLVGVAAVVAAYRAIKGKPAMLFGILGCILIAGFIYRFTDVGKIRNNDLYDGVEDVGGIGGAPPAPPGAPPAGR